MTQIALASRQLTQQSQSYRAKDNEPFQLANKMANGTPIQWRVAEPEAAKAIKDLLETNKIDGIEIIHIPA